jgi:hypothetical protein
MTTGGEEWADGVGSKAARDSRGEWRAERLTSVTTRVSITYTHQHHSANSCVSFGGEWIVQSSGIVMRAAIE